MSSSESWRFNGPERRVDEADGPALRATSSPLPRAPEGRIQPPVVPEPRRLTGESRPVRAQESPVVGIAGVMQKLATLGRTVLPLLPHVLPMDRKVGVAVSAVSNMVAARPQPAGAPPPAAPSSNPLEESLSELRSGHSELRDQLDAQSTSLKQLEKEMSTVRETAERQSAEHEELVESWESLKKKTLLFGIVVSVLLVASIACNVFLFLRH